jgi:phosphatidylserine/phosphatidylglycerophosphate/cardiolipin synthase-like enzyme
VRTREWLPLLLGIVLVVLVLLVVFWYVRRLPLPGQPPAPTADRPYQVFFTTPVFPDRPESRRGGIDERFVEFLDAATRTLDLAVYDFDLENVAQAIVRATRRGVAVRMVTDTDTVENTRDEQVQKALGLVRGAGVEIVADGRGAIMHHKFAVRDAEEVWTGSWNWTVGDTYRLNNNAVRIRSGDLAAEFTREFEKMFVQRRFGPSKRTGPPAGSVQVGAARIQPLFAPQDGVAGRLADRIGQATTRIGFMAFSFTHDGIGQATTNRFASGVPVVGVFERTGSETRFSEFGRMKAAGLEVYQDGNPYAMHHKVFVLDARTTVFGSFNFSDGADRENDENCLFVDDPEFTALYVAELDRVVSAARAPAPARGPAGPERPR